jgi:hypothetical protein
MDPFFTKRRYEQTQLWREHEPLRHEIENAMAALGRFIPDGWVGPKLGVERGPSHSVRLALLWGDPPSFWTAFRVGQALHRLGNEIPNRLGARLLDHREFDGAAHELEVGGMLAAGRLEFDWHPIGGDVRLRQGACHYVEMKARHPLSERANHAMMWQFRLREELSRLLDGRAVSYALDPDANVAARHSRQQREALLADPGIIARPLADAARPYLVDDTSKCTVEVEGIGRLWVAATEDELEQRGFQGYALDQSYEAHQVVRSCVNAALRQVPVGSRALIVLRYNGVASPSIVLTEIFRRLQRIEDQCAVDGVLLLQGSMTLSSGCASLQSWFVPGPRELDEHSMQVLRPFIAEYPLPVLPNDGCSAVALATKE